MPFKKSADTQQTQTTAFSKNAYTLQTQTTLIHKIADMSQTQTDCRQPCLFNSGLKVVNRRFHPLDGHIGEKLLQRLPLKFYGGSFGAIKMFEN